MAKRETEKTCPRCGGDGKESVLRGLTYFTVNCRLCRGIGKVYRF